LVSCLRDLILGGTADAGRFFGFVQITVRLDMKRPTPHYREAYSMENNQLRHQ